LGETRVKGGELYRVITERARELLSSIKQSIVQAGDEGEDPMAATQNNKTINQKKLTMNSNLSPMTVQ
jgi:hypothetical protein